MQRQQLILAQSSGRTQGFLFSRLAYNSLVKKHTLYILVLDLINKYPPPYLSCIALEQALYLKLSCLN